MTMILMRSPKGGVGTTFLTARLAIALAARGYEVSAIDATAQDSLKLYFELSPTQAHTTASRQSSKAFNSKPRDNGLGRGRAEATPSMRLSSKLTMSVQTVRSLWRRSARLSSGQYLRDFACL